MNLLQANENCLAKKLEKTLRKSGPAGTTSGRGPESALNREGWRAAWSMTPASHWSMERAGNPGSNPGGRTNEKVQTPQESLLMYASSDHWLFIRG